MRDERFKAVHRGGPLDLQRHRLLATWAADCAEHVSQLYGVRYPQDDRLRKAIEAARGWVRGEVTVGAARAASLEAHAAARNAANAAACAAARAAGHAAATAHMADHALRAAAFATQAVQAAGDRRDHAMAVDRERLWQQGRLPEEISELVLSAGNERPAGDRPRDRR
jgi:hypothetical protein